MVVKQVLKLIHMMKNWPILLCIYFNHVLIFIVVFQKKKILL